MLMVFIAAFVVLVGVLALSVDRASRPGVAVPSAQAIVVLGARVLAGGEATPALQRRADRAAVLYREGRAPIVVFSGGSAGSRPSEASIARDIAVARGVPPGVCVLEDKSHSTAQNASLTVPLLKDRAITEVLLVSDGYHLKRAQAHFAQLGITAHPVASGRELTAAGRVYWTMREVAALLRRPWLLWA